MTDIVLRPFRNRDLPELVRLWHQAELGRGAATGFSCDEFDYLVTSQPYFDPAGLILACDSQRIVGCVHAALTSPTEEMQLAAGEGVICLVLVHPDVRRQGIGRQLVRQAEEYLLSHGASRIFAGAAEPHDMFYVGLYGGVSGAGFLESDPLAAPFFAAMGYVPASRTLVFQRSLAGRKNIVSPRLQAIRRTTRLGVVEVNMPASWYWQTRLGRLDTLELGLAPKNGGPPIAHVRVVGLEQYFRTWQSRAIGLTELFVIEPQRRKGYGQALLVEVCQRLKDDSINLVEAHTRADASDAIAVLTSAGFAQVDTGIVYLRDPAGGGQAIAS